jgi:peptidoglycan-N-acetylglucosamine deacetylase
MPLDAAQDHEAAGETSQSDRRLVALTFDDGPSMFSQRIMDILNDSGVQATFFVVGERLRPYVRALREAVAAGHQLGNHTYTHRRLVGLHESDIFQELARAQTEIASACGVPPTWFRPPHGESDDRIEELAGSLGLRNAAWSVDPQDWDRPGVTHIVARVLLRVQPGSVILLHDGGRARGGDRSQTVAALPVILHGLKSQGYGVTTLDEIHGWKQDQERRRTNENSSEFQPLMHLHEGYGGS